MTTLRFNFFILAILTAISGCTTKFPSITNPLQIDRTEYGRLFDSTILVLREQGYRVDRQDFRFGRITTHPVYSPTAFEPWLPSNSTAIQALASTINFQRRQITVSIEKPESDEMPISDAADLVEPNNYFLRTEVVIERLVAPTTRMSGSTAARRVINQPRSVPEEWRRRGITHQYWRPIERDFHLEQRLLDAIVRRSLDAPKTAAERRNQISDAGYEIPRLDQVSGIWHLASTTCAAATGISRPA